MQQDLTYSLELAQKTQKINRSTNKVSYHQKRPQRLQNGEWNEQESKKYFKFVKSNCKTFKNKVQRRKRKIFQKMSERIQTRSANQCRSHHQKLIQKFGSQEEIMKHLAATYLSLSNESCQISCFENKQSQLYISTIESQNTDLSSYDRLLLEQDEDIQLGKQSSQDNQKQEINNLIDFIEFNIFQPKISLFQSLISQ